MPQLLHVERVAQAVADEQEASTVSMMAMPGKNSRCGRGGEEAADSADHQAERRGRLLHADAQERQRRLGQDGGADADGDQHDDRLDHVGQDVAPHDAGSDADGARRLDVLVLASPEEAGPDDAGGDQPDVDARG